ncbi:MAG: A/G-specific adenine glycosylase [Daejeonella sp.]|nr:A/G-specific adenine glycosylase [Daejeonella sp.]
MNFSTEIIQWYQQNKRDLPWRNTKDPYVIWLSEIILQQTRVEQGTPYFYRFAENYPTVSDFASASENEILNHWQGLGYYSRGRNMHYTARMVMEKHNGVFPRKYEDLISLKGIGEYTAAAISSFSADEVRAVVDGNVYRLLARYYGIATPINSSKGKKDFFELANKLISKSQPGMYNQAIMEFGSLQCRPANPLCGSCPLRLNCVAFNNNLTGNLPVKIKTQKIKTRYFNYVVAVVDSCVLINKRGANDIWENLHDFPLFETSELIDIKSLLCSTQFVEKFGTTAAVLSVHGPVKHILSHQKIYAQFFVIENFSESFLHKNSWQYVSYSDLEQLAQPKLIFEFLKSFL